ncbi:urease accessory protein UreE [Hyphomicrobium sp.]|uniref:urease accessory protein UreE n=1 Tax=Hyphomicrobium sp. TaxID=82 RepID=UPI000FC2EC1C|nr:urease accessory protein UreE [Hyphomicrobium sp.]RUP10727.1 MAG: urease accessory protein UreE [Hyphomicrobium sp.]
MGIITDILGRADSLQGIWVLDPLLLTSQQRSSPHFVAQTASGREVHVSLPRGTELQDGDVLAIQDENAVVVQAENEDLLFIRPSSEPIMWWVTCYQLGNLHRPVRFLDDGILTPYDAMALNVLQGFGCQIERASRPFVGRRFGAVQNHHQAHSHGESRSHSDHHDDHHHAK